MRITRYVVRRHLGFSWNEWESLPWYQQDVYIEGLHLEFDKEEGDD